MISTACKYGHQPCIDRALAEYNIYKENRSVNRFLHVVLLHLYLLTINLQQQQQLLLLLLLGLIQLSVLTFCVTDVFSYMLQVRSDLSGARASKIMGVRKHGLEWGYHPGIFKNIFWVKILHFGSF